MTDEIVAPQVRMSIQDHVCVISLDNPAKKNAITPEMMQQLSQHLTAFDDDDELWVAVLDPEGEHATEHEMYDLERDHDERDNLVDVRAGHARRQADASRLGALRERLREAMDRTGTSHRNLRM